MRDIFARMTLVMGVTTSDDWLDVMRRAASTTSRPASPTAAPRCASRARSVKTATGTWRTDDQHLTVIHTASLNRSCVQRCSMSSLSRTRLHKDLTFITTYWHLYFLLGLSLEVNFTAVNIYFCFIVDCNYNCNYWILLPRFYYTRYATGWFALNALMGQEDKLEFSYTNLKVVVGWKPYRPMTLRVCKVKSFGNKSSKLQPLCTKFGIRAEVKGRNFQELWAWSPS